MSKTELSDAQLIYLDAHYGLIKNEELAARLDIPETTMRRIAAKRGLTAGKHGGPRKKRIIIAEPQAGSPSRSWNETAADLREIFGIAKEVPS